VPFEYPFEYPVSTPVTLRVRVAEALELNRYTPINRPKLLLRVCTALHSNAEHCRPMSDEYGRNDRRQLSRCSEDPFVSTLRVPCEYPASTLRVPFEYPWSTV
jgi:hypothetical protein